LYSALIHSPFHITRDTNYHIANHRFRSLVDQYRGRYHGASRKEKAVVAQQVVKEWRNKQPTGRFLARTNPELGDESKWHDVGNEVAHKKASKILCEKSSSTGEAGNSKRKREHATILLSDKEPAAQDGRTKATGSSQAALVATTPGSTTTTTSSTDRSSVATSGATIAAAATRAQLLQEQQERLWLASQQQLQPAAFLNPQGMQPMNALSLYLTPQRNLQNLQGNLPQSGTASDQQNALLAAVEQMNRAARRGTTLHLASARANSSPFSQRPALFSRGAVSMFGESGPEALREIAGADSVLPSAPVAPNLAWNSQLARLESIDRELEHIRELQAARLRDNMTNMTALQQDQLSASSSVALPDTNIIDFFLEHSQRRGGKEDAAPL